jgi:hypothetical protein
MISVLLPSDATEYEAHLKRILSTGTLHPFDPLIIDFIDAVSKAVLLDPLTRRMPEILAVAHWMRKAHILELHKDFELQRGNRVWLSRGMVLHFAPSNVDSIFLYSWFISMLLGNGNIVRLSDRRGQQVNLLLSTINRICAQERFHAILHRSLVLSYDHDDALTQELSEKCQVRVLWGGDQSIRRLRAIPMNPLASEIAFANRFSLAMLNAAAVAEARTGVIDSLAASFCNDAYWFDQMACSSPRSVVWVGTPETYKRAASVFWRAVSREIQQRGIEYPEVVGLNKLVAAYVSAAIGISDLVLPNITSAVSRVHLAKNAAGGFREVDCGGGLFFEIEIPALDELKSFLTQREQTLSYFGFEEAQLKAFALTLPPRAVDRVVPVGTALNFSTVWDGSNLLQVFSREVDLR